MKKISLVLPTFFIAFAPLAASAICPVCTVAVGAALGLSRWLGVDDTVSGLWVGGLLAAVSGWTINWLNAKHIRFLGRKPLVVIFWYGLTLWPLWYFGMIGHAAHVYWGVDKLLLGTAMGTVFFAAGALGYEAMKKRNGGRAHFQFEKIVWPIAPLMVLSAVFYWLTRVNY